jgi:tetratricopeptide (TPR) repeat protein
MSKKDPAGAEPLFRESLAMRRALFGEQHPAVGIGHTNLAMAQMRLGRRADALANFQQSLTILLATLGPNHPTIASVEGNLGGFYHEGGDHAAALTHFRAALDIRRRAFDANHPYLLANLSDIGRCLTDLKRYREAEAALLEAYQGLEPQRQKQARVYNALLDRLGEVYRAMGRADEAAKYETLRKASS